MLKANSEKPEVQLQTLLESIFAFAQQTKQLNESLIFELSNDQNHKIMVGLAVTIKPLTAPQEEAIATDEDAGKELATPAGLSENQKTKFKAEFNKTRKKLNK